MSEALIGRQPIFDRKLGVHGYELLFRGDVNPEDPSKADFATSKVIVNTFSEIGLETLVSGRKAFVNLTRSFIVGDYPLPFETGSGGAIVLEVLENVKSEPEVLAGLKRLKGRGFTIALDDFVFSPGCEPLIELADLVKLDVLGLSDDEIAKRVEQLRPFDVILLAEKIETRAQFKSCRAMGFDYFQGFFLERPSTVRSLSVGPRALTLLSLLNELHSPSFTFQRAEEIVKHDVGLCYRFLRHINSALYGMPRKIASVREALVYLGVYNVQNLTSLFLIAANDETPREMITSAMMRARMCENLARAASAPAHNQYFVVGLFSTLDALMEVPMSELLERLPLSADQKIALRGEPGPMTDALATVVAYEHADWDRVGCLGLSLTEIKQTYLEALQWAQAVAEAEAGRAA